MERIIWVAGEVNDHMSTIVQAQLMFLDSIDRNDCPPNPEREDLLAFAKLLTDMFPDLQIGAYYGRFKDETQKEAGFETIFETDPEKSLRKQ